jgi:hypothetical protein
MDELVEERNRDDAPAKPPPHVRERREAWEQPDPNPKKESVRP